MAKVSVKDLSLVQIYTREGAHKTIENLATKFGGVVHEKKFNNPIETSDIVLNAWVPKDQEEGFFAKVSGRYDAKLVDPCYLHKDLKTIDM